MALEAPARIELSCAEVDQLRKFGKPFVFVDCREPDEAVVARIEGATLIPLSQMVGLAGQFPAEKTDLVVVHCHHGGRSLRMAMWLRGQGYSKACSMSGGIDEWSQTIDPSIPRY